MMVLAERQSDDALRERTHALLAAAERVSAQLESQNERLAEAIDLFQRDVLTPLKQGVMPDGTHRPEHP